MRKTLAILVMPALLLSPSEALADVEDLPDDKVLHWDIRESFSETQSGAGIEAQIDGEIVEIICNEFGKGKLAKSPPGFTCDPAGYRGNVYVGFPSLQAAVCTKSSRNCIQNVFVLDESGVEVPGKFIGYLDADTWVPANKTLGNHVGASPGVWQIPGVLNSAGTDFYEVHLSLEGGGVTFRSGRQINKFDVKNRSFNAAIRPVKIKTGDGVIQREACSDCSALPIEYTFGLSALLPQSVKSWYAGRIQGADIKYKKVDSNYFQVTITGRPMEVPTFQGRLPKSMASASLLNLYKECQPSWPYCPAWHNNGYASGWKWQDFLQHWRPLVKDSATGSATLWTVRTVTVFFGMQTGDRGFAECAPTNRAAGFVSTNALIYDGMVPDYERGFFNYRVGGMHYAADGTTEFRGQYEMVMDEQLARCMFNFPKVPLSATISVSGIDGEDVVATTLVSSSNGKLRLTASNFTFSEKTIKIKVNARGYSICVKGNKTIHVKNNRCPSGYKKV